MTAPRPYLGTSAEKKSRAAMPLCTKPRNILPSCLRLFLTKTARRRDQHREYERPCFPARLVPGRTLKINAQIWKVPFLNSLTWDILRNIYGKLSYKEIFRFVFYMMVNSKYKKAVWSNLFLFPFNAVLHYLGSFLRHFRGPSFWIPGNACVRPRRFVWRPCCHGPEERSGHWVPRPGPYPPSDSAEP